MPLSPSAAVRPATPLPAPVGALPRLGARGDLALLALWLLLTIAWRPLSLPDEGRYAGIAFEMLRSGTLVPTLDGLPYFHKPPLLYALDVAAMSLFGVHAWVARLGPALLGWLLGAAGYAHLRRRHGAATARCGLLVLATMPLYFFGAQYVNHDIGVAACITAAVLCGLRAVETPGQPAARWIVVAGACAGLGLLAKGLIGLVLPALILLPWLAVERRWRDLRAFASAPGLLAMAAVAGPWMLAMQARHPAFFDYFIVEQHFRRYTDVAFNNVRPFWFLIVALPLTSLPWSPFAWGAVRALRERRLPEGQAPLVRLYLWWIVVVVGFFSLPASKLIGYVMPAALPLAALVAVGLQDAAPRMRWLAGLAIAVCLGGVSALAWHPPVSHADLGRALASQWQAGDRLVYANAPYFDLRFEARLVQPAIVLSDWDAAAVRENDTWRKELADTARFDPAGAAATLWTWDRLPQLGCGASRLWIVTPAAQRAHFDGLAGLVLVLDGRDGQLLRWDHPSCREGGSR